MSLKKNIASLSLAVLLAAGTVVPCFAEGNTKESLLDQLKYSAEIVSKGGVQDLRGLYTNIEVADRADSLPARFDLRDRGVVSPIRNQDSFGACWSFASISASETSILSSMGLTVQEYAEKYGEELNLSERHLAWFSTMPIVAEEGMSERDAAQVGEGRVVLDDDGSAHKHMDNGGLMGYASCMFAAGIGPVFEKTVPYQANDGSSSTAADWSVDESLRFAYQWELKDAAMLPTPAGRDEQGNYRYNPIATMMIKQELLAGRAVSIGYNADQAMKPEEKLIKKIDAMRMLGVPEYAVEIYACVEREEYSLDDLSEEELMAYYIAMMCYDEDVPYEDVTDEDFSEYVTALMNKQENSSENPAEPTEEELQAAAEAEAASRAAAERLGLDYDKLVEEWSQAEEKQDAYYMNFDTFAHYVYDASVGINHAVVIVGYDDNYPATNFNAEHLPPDDGAWIVRNSWDTDYAIDGYFYLSYYDQSIMLPETFEFVTDINSLEATGLEIEEYDFMPFSVASSLKSQNPVYMANEFTVQKDSVLSYVSAMTANYDTNVTVAVYLLREGATSPTDGVLLDVRTENFKYAGYHRIPLSQHYKLPKGAEVSVVVTQRYNDMDGMHYALPYAIENSCEFCRTWNTLCQDEVFMDGLEGRVGRNESFVGTDGEWTDWADMLDEVKATDVRINDFVSFDNHSIKIYLYHLDEISGQHSFGEAIPYADGSIQLCTDCGYSLVER